MSKKEESQAVAIRHAAGLASRALARLEAAGTEQLRKAEKGAKLQAVSSNGDFSALIKHGDVTIQIENGTFAIQMEGKEEKE
jgi:hypothetical protein